MNDAYQVKLDAFEGPLDLLLHLIQELEIDIYDIQVAEMTDQYMHYIHTMQQIDLNVASEYLVMAATLLEMKSAMLLPKKEIELEDEYEEDPRDELMTRLIEYRKYKEAAEQLQEMELEENQIYTRERVEFTETDQPKVERGPLSIYDMLHALDNVFKRKSWNEPLQRKINRTEISLEDRMKEIRIILKDKNHPVAFDELFLYPIRSYIVTTFLAVLQLLKDKQISCSQAVQFEQIYVSWIGV